MAEGRETLGGETFRPGDIDMGALVGLASTPGQFKADFYGFLGGYAFAVLRLDDPPVAGVSPVFILRIGCQTMTCDGWRKYISELSTRDPSLAGRFRSDALMHFLLCVQALYNAYDAERAEPGPVTASR